MYIKNIPYHLPDDGIDKIANYYKARFMGAWCIKDKYNNWNNEPVDVFYQPEPDIERGHSNYFGVFKARGEDGKLNLYVCDAKSAFSEPIYGVLCDDGEVLISRYVNDMKQKGDHMIDGGRDYIRRSQQSKLIEVSVRGGEFLMNEV